MRTTIDLDADVLCLAKEMARERRSSLGRMISTLIRKALTSAPVGITQRNGVPVFAAELGALPLELDRINELRDGAD